MPIINEPATPPPAIGKMGPYTVFLTPTSNSSPATVSDSPKRSSISSLPVKSTLPVQPPPVQYQKSTSSKGGFFWDAVAKVQNAHSSLDEYVAHWFGLNQSKYQWALDDYYESKGMDKVATQVKDASTEAQIV
ncbi:uncharacterized protein [Rutidosis leptorrhynchoides]|uniref:uncharacterized protein n=1 Tax=Rutidosis leptorrhynchoides TaxID=125765 RepID=UPI003A99028C